MMEFFDYYIGNIIITGITIFLLTMMLKFFILGLNKYILPVRMYLSDITSYTMADLKKRHAILYRQVLIKNLYIMVTIVKWAVFIMAIGVVLCLGFITYQNKDYFTKYFEAKQQKLELATEEKVDEMLQTIKEQKQYSDSVIMVNTIKLDSISGIVGKLQIENTKLIERNKNLNYMINNLNQIISAHGMQTKK